MEKNNPLILFLIGFLLVLSSCNSEDSSFNKEPAPDTFDTPEFYSIEYDFSKKEIKEFSSSKFKESFENNSDQVVPMTFFPYLDQGMAEFNMEEMGKFLDGLECEVPVPEFENNTWNETETNSIKTIFGKTTSFNPINGNTSFTINFDPWETTKYTYVITFSELTVPFEVTFIGANYGGKYNFSGILKIRVPINCDIKIGEPDYSGATI